MATDFKKGNVVRLKSGGPVMTIESLGDYGIISSGAMCVWFDGAKRVSDVFDLESLEVSS